MPGTDAMALDVTRVGVVGSGIMGSGLAEVAARAGYEVVVRSRSEASAQAMLDELGTRLAKQVGRGALDAAERDAVLGRVHATCELEALTNCDLVVESVVEDLAVKRQLFAALDEIVQPAAILATNTSTLPVVDIAMATRRPEQVCGIHFFNPAPVMALVEVVEPITASPSTIEAALAFARACGKDAVVVRDSAGFVVNALLFPYLNDAVRLWERGTASIDDVDRAMTGGCNFPMGPFALLDLVGLDTSVAILEALYEDSREPRLAPAPTLRRMVAAGRLGRKAGHGFYEYPRRA